MAKKKEPEKQGNEELFLALDLLEKEKGIPAEYMLDKIKKAISTACKNNYGNEDVDIDVDREKGVFNVYLRKEIVEEVEDPNRQYLLDKAKQVDPTACVGRFVRIKLDTKQFGRVAAQTARNIIRQGIRDSERGQMMEEFQSKHQELVSGLVERIDPRTGAISLRLGKAEAVLPKNEQIGGENVKEGDYIKVYVVDVRETEKGPKAIISRTHPDLVKRMFETEVPEIYDGTVEIKAVSREAGSRTKLAVMSNDPAVDAVGACIGARGSRVSEIVDELGGEKIDIVEYSEEPKQFIAAALSPANVLLVELAEDGSRSCRVTVPDNQLSLAIGNKGQNARLAAKLTGWKIDIKPESGFYGEEQ
ncbi:MAG TPA: transcription termination factor NusA [Candidatus Acutalibacter stercoravium]|nr:transcription termination factor NusA [Candidatus Acutalibacter stercoravium]